MFEMILSFAYLVFITVLVFVDFYLSYKTSKKEAKILKDFDERMKKLEEKLASL